MAARFSQRLRASPWPDFDASIDEAIEQGWAAKADTVEELAEAFGLVNLPKTVEAYNEACAAGYDDEFFLPADYLRPIAEGPFYVFEYNPGAWVTFGGIKTDGFCRAVNVDNDIVPGLYVAGVDGDFWSTPYYQGGSCNGFSLGSGVLAGKTAARDVLDQACHARPRVRTTVTEFQKVEERLFAPPPF